MKGAGQRPVAIALGRVGRIAACTAGLVACVATGLLAVAVPARAQAAQAAPAAPSAPALAFPYYRAEHALQGLHDHHLPALLQSFHREAAALAQAARRHCAGDADRAALKQSWDRARLAWMAASTPAMRTRRPDTSEASLLIASVSASSWSSSFGSAFMMASRRCVLPAAPKR